jgi:hypothetical protein
MATNGEQAFVGSGNQQPEAEEVRRLRRENEVLRQERDILKKALAIFSRELVEKIVEIFQAHRGVYGSQRNHAALAEQGIRIGRKPKRVKQSGLRWPSQPTHRKDRVCIRNDSLPQSVTPLKQR